MRLRSLDQLNLDRSWQRVLHQVRAAIMDVPDRLPFEVTARFWADSPELSREHQVQQIQRVPATRPGQSTVRPFVRVHPRDLLLYQALVDALRHEIEASLGSREQIFAYRLSEIDQDDPFADSPRWTDFNVALHQLALDEFDGYVLEGDVASFFLNINTIELQRRLLEAGCDGNVVRDLGGLLEGWASHGIRGLPQGILPSSPLANFYLAPLDRLLESEGVTFIRYMDDFAVVCETYHEARKLLDMIEEALYEDWLSLGGGKTSITRSEGVVTRLTPEEGVEELISILEDVGDYAPDEAEIEEIRFEQACEIFDNAVRALDDDEYRRGEFTFALRQLARHRHPHALEALPQVLLRMPGLTSVACRYMEATATAEHRDAVASTLVEITSDRFHRAQEWLHLLRAIQVIPDRAASALNTLLAELASEHVHPLVRARALLAWGHQSDENDFGVADHFFERESRTWLPYALVAVQGKRRGERDDRYARWSGEGRSLAQLAEFIRAERFAWSRI